MIVLQAKVLFDTRSPNPTELCPQHKSREFRNNEILRLLHAGYVVAKGSVRFSALFSSSTDRTPFEANAMYFEHNARSWTKRARPRGTCRTVAATCTCPVVFVKRVRRETQVFRRVGRRRRRQRSFYTLRVRCKII